MKQRWIERERDEEREIDRGRDREMDRKREKGRDIRIDRYDRNADWRRRPASHHATKANKYIRT